MMSCFSAVTYQAYVDGELPRVEQVQVEAHLATCARCQAYVAGLVKENQLFAQALAEVELAPEAAERLQARWARTAARPEPRRALLVATLGLVAGLGFLAAQSVLTLELGPANWLNPFRLDFWRSPGFAILFYLQSEGIAMLLSVMQSVATFILALVALGVLLKWLRRRLALTATLLVSFLLLVVGPPQAAAVEVRKADEVTIAATETIDTTLIVLSETVRVDGIIRGDLVVFAQRAVVNGEVQGELIFFGRDIDIRGTVEHGAHVIAQTMSLPGRVGGSFYVFVQRCTVEREAEISQSLLFLGQQAYLQGTVKGDVDAWGQMLDISGNVGGTVKFDGEQFALLAPASVGGNLKLRTRRKPEIDATAQVAGTVDSEVVQRRPWARYAQRRYYFHRAIWYGAAVAVGLLLMFLLPGFYQGSMQSVGRFWRSLGLGLAVLVAVPVAIVIALITVVGIPIALIVLALYLISLYLSKIVVAAFVGQALLKKSAEEATRSIPVLLLGLGVVVVATQIPYIGGWLRFAILLIGLGALAYQVYRHVRQQPA